MRTEHATQPPTTAEGGHLSGHHLEKEYTTREGNRVRALTGIDLRVDEGEFVSLVGPSGCGKTTLLKMCAGLVAPTAGTISFENTSGPPKGGRYGIVFQNPSLLPWRTVGRNISISSEIRAARTGKRRSKDEVSAGVSAALELVGLAGQTDRYPNELSGGMQQRVAIARAIFNKSNFLFMDEPFGALDALTRENLNVELQRLALSERLSILFVTHDLKEALFLSDRILVFSSRPGRILAKIEVPHPRPRTLDAIHATEMADAERRMRELLNH